jgi:uncharacterized membrane protein
VLVHRSTPDEILPEISRFGGEVKVLQTPPSNQAEEQVQAALENREAAAV